MNHDYFEQIERERDAGESNEVRKDWERIKRQANATQRLIWRMICIVLAGLFAADNDFAKPSDVSFPACKRPSDARAVAECLDFCMKIGDREKAISCIESLDDESRRKPLPSHDYVPSREDRKSPPSEDHNEEGDEEGRIG